MSGLGDGPKRRAGGNTGTALRSDPTDVPAADCDIDHVEPWAAGGPTTQANGRAACGFHNRARQRGP